MGHILRFARETGLNTLAIDLVNGEGQPADLLRDPISALPDWYTKMFWNMVTSAGSDWTLIQAATLTLSYDLGGHQPGPRAEYPQCPYTRDVSILDTRGKTYSAHFEGWGGKKEYAHHHPPADGGIRSPGWDCDGSAPCQKSEMPTIRPNEAVNYDGCEETALKLRRQRQLDSLLDDMKTAQRNTIWPTTLRGGKAIDEYLWRGAKNAPLIQRVGAVILAMAYLAVALFFISFATNGGGVLAALFAFALVAVGARIVWSANRR